MYEARAHPGGNAWSEVDPQTGVEYHPYGPHIFHTSNARVWDYLGRFSRFTSYRHHVWALAQGQMVPLPFSLATVAALTGARVTPEGFAESLGRVPYERPGNLQEKALSLVGPRLYEALIRHYTAKQWDTDPELLPPSIISRLPVRATYSTRYFSDTWEGMPERGYAHMIESMLSGITKRGKIALSTPWNAFMRAAGETTIYTGPLDGLFDFDEGHLGWRTLDFTHTRRAVEDYQGTAVVNFCDSTPTATRSVEWRHLHPERSGPFQGTLVTEETSRWAAPGDEPFYPVPTPDNSGLASSYRARAANIPGLHVGGRLGAYAYLDMHQAVASGLALAERLIKET